MHFTRISRQVETGPRPARRRRRGTVTVEAAIFMPIIVMFLLGVWETGRLIQVTRILQDAAREGARVAAGGISNGAPVTVAVVQQTVQNYLTGAGFPSAAATAATVAVTNLSTDTWTDPYNALPEDNFSVQVTIPAGAPFASLFWGPTTFVGITQLSTSVQWASNNDAQVVVNTQLPY